MHRHLTILLSLLTVFAIARAQQFIGCRTSDGWAETAMLRKTFTIEVFHDYGVDAIVTSLGYHELYLNGKRVSDNVMQPAVSQLDKRALSVIYDISDYIHEGENEIVIVVGQGWGRIYGTPAVVHAEMDFRVLPDLIFSDNYTDTSWEATPLGYSYTGSWQPMQFGGERFDARVQPEWRPATIYDDKDLRISPQKFKGNRVVDTLQPVSISRYDSGNDSVVLIGFDRALTGWFQVEFKPMAAGTEVTMEYLDHYEAKPPFTESDVYIARGSGRELFTNRFHTHTFSYVRIKGADIIGCRALQISAVDPHEGATFECSDPRLNAIHDMVKYTLSCLTFSGYMVDCPHIERMGYGGDGNSSTMTLQTFWDVRDTYLNWLVVWCDAMDSTGDLPYVAPAYRTGGGPYWSGFIIKAPYRTWLNYGDISLMAECYENMCRWLDFVEKHCEDGILKPWPDTERRAWFLGDWLAPEGVDVGGESAVFVSNCFLAECLSDMVQMASAMVFREEDAARFATWREQLVRDIHRHFYHPESHTYANGTVLDQCYALLLGIPPDSATAQAVKEQLLKDIHGKYRDHIAVGLLGVPVFTEWCIRERQAGLMATILRQEDYPGYLHMINQGATTTWESWGCGMEGKEDRSRVHNCYNGIGIWFYQALAGIRPDPEQPGYKHFFVDPQPVDGVDWLHATKPTPYGTIRVDIGAGKLTVSVPEGTTATLFPGTERQQPLSPGTWTVQL